jgi:serine/threonine-protein kinase RsbT
MLSEVENIGSLKIEITSEQDILRARTLARRLLIDNIKCSPLDRLHILTVISELSRNIFRYAKKGKVTGKVINQNNKEGFEMEFSDDGPGIENVEEALQSQLIDNSSKGNGIGLAGSKKLMDEFEIHSQSGVGTKIRCVKWI